MAGADCESQDVAGSPTSIDAAAYKQAESHRFGGRFWRYPLRHGGPP